eukprot:CAMPEP_0168618830 /NCGR_PEP_ID=MMETSP0449_2-20121227/6277_1 /TAXON_ID=1082188 /ORGANISM="Strombidium rassoulzadegani, Strain ras09" /LENGTH=139 /DNA_ID=CAMNT_0008659723 /DNA_START=1 /DNA_END=420 /DNA_ORIENTATION=+
MALNPPLNMHGEPNRVSGEAFILTRHGLDFEVKIEGLGKLKGKGMAYLTTSRIVLVKKDYKDNDPFKAFDIPIAYTFNESFEQPIFGANYIKGKCKPLVPGSLPADPQFKIWFMEGGCGRFLKSWRYCLSTLRENAGSN